MSETLEHVPAAHLVHDEPRDLAAMDSLDLLLLLALLPLHWTMFFLVVAQWFIRRNPRLLAGLLRYVGADHLLHSPTAADYLPGLKKLLPPPPAAPSPARDEQTMLATLLHQAPAATSPAPAPSVSPSPTPEASAGPPLPFTDWRRRVLAAHNVIVVGNPQSGKSTLTRAFLPALAKLGDICILDPHGTRNRWPWQAIGSGRDYVAIAHALDLLADELDQRYQQPAALRRLSIIIDEVPSITLHQKQPWERTYPQLVFEGAKADMRTWILAQSAQVEPLGLKGKGDLRTSLTWLYLGEQAIAQCAACAAQPYPAALEQRGVVLPIDTTPLAVYARLPVDEHAQWMVPPAAHGSAPVQSAEPHPNAVQPGSAVPPEPAEPAHQAATDALNLNLDDLRKLAHALRLYAGGSGKVKAIEQAFRCRKGGGSVYQRAHWLVTQALAEQRSTASDDDPDDPPGAFGFLNQ